MLTEHKKETVLLWIISLLLNIVTVSLNINVPFSNENMYPCLVNSVDWFLSYLQLHFSLPVHWYNACFLNPLCYCILTFDLAKHAIPKWCTGRKWHIPMASNRKKSRWRIWLTKWAKVKAHDTLIDWCTGREWPLNCMTVISAWWRSNIPFQRLSGRLNYYITRWRQEVRELEVRWVRRRCFRERHRLAEGALGTPSEFGDLLVTRCGRESQHSAESWASGPRFSSPERKRHTAMSGGAGEVNMLQFLFSLHLPLTRKPYNKVRDIFFLKKSSHVFIHCVNLYSAVTPSG